MVYGLQINFPSEIARLQAALDTNRFEIVDMGTLAHLAAQETPRLKQEEKNFFTNLKPGSSVREAVAWNPKVLTDATQWSHSENLTMTAKGLKLVIPTNATSTGVELRNILIPKTATRIKINVPEISGCRWYMTICGIFSGATCETVDIQGRHETQLQASWQPFNEWMVQRKYPGEDNRPLDKRIIRHALENRPVNIWLNLQGAPGSYAVFTEMDFVTE